MVRFSKKLVLFLLLYISVSYFYSKNILSDNIVYDNILDYYLTKKVSPDFLVNMQLRSYVQENFIVKIVLPWMNTHKGKFPRRSDFGIGYDKINISIHKLFNTKIYDKVYIGIFDSRKDFVDKVAAKAKELGVYDRYIFPSFNSDTEDNIHIKYIRSITVHDLEDPQIRKHAQEYFIRHVLFPWLQTHNGKFPKRSEYKNNILGLSFVKVFGLKAVNRPPFLGIFDSSKDLIKKAYELDVDHSFIPIEEPINPHVFYIYNVNPSDLKDPIKKEEIQRYFIENILFPWILAHDGKFPKEIDFNKTTMGISYVKLFGLKIYKKTGALGIFNSISDLREKAIELDKDHKFIPIKTDENIYLSYLYNVEHNTLKDPIIREELQRYFIENVLFPWILAHNGRYPKELEFNKPTMGISFAKLFGVKNYRGRRLLGIFGSNLELRAKAYSIAKNTPAISEDIFFSRDEKTRFSSNLDKLDFNNTKKVDK